MDKFLHWITENPEILATAFIGGLLGTALTMIAVWAYRVWNRPILALTFDRDDHGCDVSTLAFVGPIHGGQAPTHEQRYLRLKIEDRGNTFARGVSACITRIAFVPRNSRGIDFEEEVMDLKLAIYGDRKFDLASGGHRFVDLAHALRPVGHVAANFSIDVEKVPVRLIPLFGDAIGSYVSRIFVSAENAQSLRADVAWSWDGTLEGLTIDRDVCRGIGWGRSFARYVVKSRTKGGLLSMSI